MWWWRLFAESPRRRRCAFCFCSHSKNPCSDYFQIFAVCILALGNLPGRFFLRFSVSSTKFRMAIKILRRFLLGLFLIISSMHIGPDDFFWRFSASPTKSKMAAKILCRSLELEPFYGFGFMFGLKEKPWPGHVLISFWCDSDNNNFFFTFQNFCEYFSFVHFGHIKIW